MNEWRMARRREGEKERRYLLRACRVESRCRCRRWDGLHERDWPAAVLLLLPSASPIRCAFFSAGKAPPVVLRCSQALLLCCCCWLLLGRPRTVDSGHSAPVSVPSLAGVP